MYEELVKEVEPAAEEMRVKIYDIVEKYRDVDVSCGIGAGAAESCVAG